MRYIFRACALFLISSFVLISSLPQSSVVQAKRGPAPSFWGLSAYLTKLERYDGFGTQDDIFKLAEHTTQAGAQWTQEELSWALTEPTNNQFNPIYDSSLQVAHHAGLNVIGMLITTPAWARDAQCSGNYFCPPSNPAEFGAWAGWMAERYDGDGIADAPGSPRISAWQIWNEVNFPSQLPLNDESQRRMRYGQMLVAAYQAIKAADPSATVLLGGVYIFDGSQGLSFLNPHDGVLGLVPEARNAFDALAIHPFMPTVAPDSPDTLAIVTLEGRLRNTRSWLNSLGRTDAGIWITEIGWCTIAGSECPAVSEAQQAQYLIRALVIAQQRGVAHTSWFQLEDAFDGQIDHPWRGAAIVHNYTGSTYPPKPAYLAYQTLATTLADAVPAGTGPIHTFAYPANHYGPLGQGTYDMRYTRGTTVIDVLWLPRNSATVSFPVLAGREVSVLTRNGQTLMLPITNNSVELTISEDPLIVVQSEPPPPPILTVHPGSLAILARPQTIGRTTLSISNQNPGVITWSAHSDAAWLSLAATSGSTPSTMIISAQAPATVGNYTATITVEGGSGGTRHIPVNLRVSDTIYTRQLPLLRR